MSRRYARGLSFGSRLGLLAAWLTLAIPGAALAHMGSTKSIDVTLAGDRVVATVEVDALDASLAVGTPARPTTDTLRPHAPVLTAWLADGVSVRRGDLPCPSRIGAPALHDDRIALEVVAACPAGTGALWLTDDTVFDDDPRHETFVSVRDDDGRAFGAVLRADERRVQLSTPPSATATAVAFVREGAIHLVTGYDHVLFVLSLVLGAALWIRERGRGHALRSVAVIVTAFTIGHSISLAAAALGLVAFDPRLVEIAIAASIVLVAAINVVSPRPDATGKWIAGVFGIVHGFGFSSVLADVGLPTSHRVLALLSFNVGIELAQLAFVSLVLVAIAGWARRTSFRRFGVQGGSLVIASLGLFWLVERGLGG